jgi:VIT1/CCC1 family predicted Fe2+/Mn2+ transporter
MASSSLSFALGAALPLLANAAVPDSASTLTRVAATVAVAVVALTILGVSAAALGGARPARPTARVVLGGIAAMALTMIIGKLFGTATGA